MSYLPHLHHHEVQVGDVLRYVTRIDWGSAKIYCVNDVDQPFVFNGERFVYRGWNVDVAPPSGDNEWRYDVLRGEDAEAFINEWNREDK